MKIRQRLWTTGAAALLGLVSVHGFAQAPPATVTVLGQVESVDAPSRTIKMKSEDGASLSVTLAEKGAVVKVAPGEKSLQNAAPIALDAVTAGDRILVRGGVRTEGKVDGALRVVVMAKTDLTARNEAELKAWRERGLSGTLISADPANKEFILTASGPATPSPDGAATAGTLVVDAKNATLHRYADTSVNFNDAKPATVADMAPADQVRVLGTRSPNGGKVTAERVVFGSFRTLALAIERIEPATGVLHVKDLQTNKKFTISAVAGATIRKIPAEMGAMFAMMSGGGTGAGRPGMGGGRPESGGPPGGMGGRPGGGGQPGHGGMGAPGGQGGRPGGGGRGGRGMEDMVDRLPAITLADLKKDDWIGAVVGKADAAGHATAFNLLAGIEVFAARANRGGGVDVGMPAGLLDGALGVP